jgi:tRNA-Thr(GGU) m(6)t(6)A37 methyltransferase TsaA
MHKYYSMEPIATVSSPYKEKFGIPRQPGLANSLVSTIKFLPDFSSPDIIRGLEGCSHIWLIFIFSECVDKGWTPTVRPPRLGGNKRLGVFATRSPYRPNPVGLSPVKLLSAKTHNSCIELSVSGADLLDGTPILDIKPYLPYSDIITTATFDIADKIDLLQQEVFFSSQAIKALFEAEIRLQQPIKEQITELLKCDPRPAYKKNDAEKSYGIKLHDLNIRFRISDLQILIDTITCEEPQKENR